MTPKENFKTLELSKTIVKPKRKKEIDFTN
jgi:hypothetical protein